MNRKAKQLEKIVRSEEFNQDSDTDLVKSGIFFILSLKQEPKKAKEAMEKLAQGQFSCLNYLKNIGMLYCITSVSNYEQIFDTKIEKVTPESGKTTLEGYRPARKETVPEALADYVSSVHLNY